MDFRKKIEFGDRIFARLIMNGKTVVEFMISTVRDMTELIGELRHVAMGKHGLAKLYIRNQSKGWSQERHLMLYAPDYGTAAQTPASDLFGYATQAQPQRTMYFPWETH